jgi:uncharacterized iron-regulated protein
MPDPVRRFGPHAFARILAVLAASALLPACTRYFASDPSLGEPSGAVVPDEAVAPRALFMFEGSTGRSLGWADVMAAASASDAIFIGERHDDPTAHAVQLAIFEDLAAGYRGTALALEHLERNEQPTVDRYLRGEIGVGEFIDTTKSRDWAGKDTWVVFFQPLVDAAREAGSPVVAANAPRDIVRRARTEGHDALAALPEPERATFEVPVTRHGGLFDGGWQTRWDAYHDRFRDFMTSDDDAKDPEARARVDSAFLSQSMWDGTMGASAERALEAGAPKVVLCAGCFHIERDGGTVLQFEARAPRAKVLTVTVIDASSPRLRDEDRLAADIVIYGFSVKRTTPDDAPEQAPAAQPAPPASEAQPAQPTQSAQPTSPAPPAPSVQSAEAAHLGQSKPETIVIPPTPAQQKNR